jgi:uncharacterized membrane protein
LGSKKIVFLLAVLLVLLAVVPIVFYLYNFGLGLWEANEDWAHLGTFFGGVLSPLFTLLSTLLLLATIYYTSQSFKTSQSMVALQSEQLKDSRVALDIQTRHSESQRFDSLFFQQLSMIQKALDASVCNIDGKEVNAHNALAHDFSRLVKEGRSFDAGFYQPYLSQALESFDQLVKMVEHYCPHQDERPLYRDLVHYNISAHFRWWIGTSWENVHPTKTEHRELLAKHYGIIRL